MIDLTKPLFRQADWSAVKDPITDEEVQDWIAELRSGKFEQAQEQLCDGVGYCCLGVLAETQGLFDQYGLKFEDGTLSGWNRQLIAPDVYYKLPDIIQDTLASLNDAGSSFARIADIIETGFFGTAEVSKKEVSDLYAAIQVELQEQEETID